MPTKNRLNIVWWTVVSARVCAGAPFGPNGALEKLKFLGSGGSMIARLKLKEIDGIAPQLAWSLRLNSTQLGETHEGKTLA